MIRTEVLHFLAVIVRGRNTLTQFARPGKRCAENKAVLRLNCFFDNATAKRHTPAETA